MESQVQELNKVTIVKQLVDFLSKLVSIPSLSKEEDQTADLIETFLKKNDIACSRIKNNIIVKNKYFDKNKASILLNSHHDTVKPNSGYTFPPFAATLEGDKIIGLGTNDAGASLTCLLFTFLHYYEAKNLKYNIILVASAEEEISGANGIEYVLPNLPPISFAIVGEPTGMQMAIAQKGLMVVDCKAIGKSGHAARNEGINSIEIAMKDIAWINSKPFTKTSDWLGETKATVTTIHTDNEQHNVVPNSCEFTIDIRMNELYEPNQILEILNNNMSSEFKARSLRLKPSSIPIDHPIVKSGLKSGLSAFGSPTLSDSALMPFHALKIGPGESSRSHTADEYILINELEQGYTTYINLLTDVL